MQYFKNNLRRSTPCAPDALPLCREQSTMRSAGCACRNETASSCSCAGARAGSTDSPCLYEDPVNCANVNTPTSESFPCEGLAIAFVPDEEFADLNTPEEALCRGSLFQRLDMPFYGGKRRGAKC